MTECNQCGDCCRVIGSAWTKRRLREDTTNASDSDVAFMLEHWHRISRVEARRRNPQIAPETPGHYFYECDMFDPATNTCTAQETKPRVCGDFPWYGRTPNPDSLACFPLCSFWTDVPAALRPENVQIERERQLVAS